MTALDRIKEKLIRLRLKTMAQNLEEILNRAKEKNQDILFVLDRLLEAETEQRWQSAIRLRFQQARLNEKLTIDSFDFHHHKSRKNQKPKKNGLVIYLYL